MKKLKLLINLIFNISLIPYCFFISLIPRNKKIWVFGEWHGMKKADNSHYLYEFVLKNEKNIKPIWITKNKKIRGENIYYYNSLKGIYYSFRAKLTFITHDLDDVNYIYSSGSIVVNLTHGIPLKKIGKDVSYLRFGKLTKIFDKYIRDKLPSKKKPNYIFSGNYMSIKNFASAYDVDVKNVFALGYPRWEDLINNKTETKNIILYAPTHRKNGDVIFKPFEIEGFKYFMKKIKELNYEFVFKPHPSLNYEISDEIKLLYGNFCSQSFSTNYYLVNSAILITDYSSILYDYAVLRRPIISLIHDLEEYLNEDAGLYDHYENLVPGPLCNNWIEIANKIGDLNISNKFIRENYNFDYNNPSKNIVKKVMEII